MVSCVYFLFLNNLIILVLLPDSEIKYFNKNSFNSDKNDKRWTKDGF